MSFYTRHEMKLQGAWKEPAVVVCCEGIAHEDGEASLNFWLETRHPASFDFETGGGEPEHTVTHGSQTVYSWSLVTYPGQSRGSSRYRKSSAPWHLRRMVIALARGDVGGKSASEMLWDVFWSTVVKQRPAWLIENAPEWWALADPKKREQQEEVKT